MTDGGQDFDLGQVVGSDGATGNGVASVTLISTSGKVKTYRMLFTDGTYVDYQVTDGSDASVTIVTSWNSTTSNSKVPSEKLTKDSLDNKVDKEIGKGLFSGSYTDLSNKPSIPSSSSDLSDGSDLIKKSNTTGLLKNDGTVDTTSYSTFDGNYNNLTNKPTIPTASTSTPSADTTSGSYGSGTSYARSNHTHPKSSLYAESSHTHTVSNITDFPSIPSSSSDLSDGSSLVKTSSTTGLLKNDGSVDTNSYLTTGSASSTYQPKLVSGTNIKTVNNESLLGSGNITIQGGSSVDVVTSWEATLSDTKVPSEKLTKNTIDGKLDNALSSTAVSIASNDDILITDYSDSNKIKRVANILASQVKDGTAHSNIGSSANDTQATINTDINTALGNKVSKSQTVGLLKNDGSIDTNTYLTSSAISGMLTTSDIADNLTTDSSTKVLSAKQGKALNDMIGSAITYIVGSGS